jgi:hypothetical protein
MTERRAETAASGFAFVGFPSFRTKRESRNVPSFSFGEKKRNSACDFAKSRSNASPSNPISPVT